ncbi:hypothetical protein [Tepidibacillus decaturensis]|nr:hypothetical protein [Tepidibacillus decaturensis]
MSGKLGLSSVITASILVEITNFLMVRHQMYLILYCRKILISTEDNEIELNEQTNTNKLYYELSVFNEIYKKKDFKHCYDLLDYSYSVMKVLDAARKDARIIFKADKSTI